MQLASIRVNLITEMYVHAWNSLNMLTEIVQMIHRQEADIQWKFAWAVFDKMKPETYY